MQPGRWLLGGGWWVVPLLLSVGVALPGVFGERWYSDGPYYQAIATRMAREGGVTWWSPMQGDLPYFNKPPLMFWVHGVLVRAFGSVDWAGHAPEGAAFVGVCLLTGWLARRLSGPLRGPLIGLLAGCAMALTNDWIVRINNFRLDMAHTLFMLGAVACWGRAWARDSDERLREWRWTVAAGVCIGAALMTKPFYGLGVCGVGLAWLWIGGMWTWRRAGLVLLGGAIGVMVAAPWHGWMLAQHGDAFLRSYVSEQTVRRAAGEFRDYQPWHWYPRLFLGTVDQAIQPARMWPIYAMATVGLGVVAARWRRAQTRRGDAMAVVWTLGWLIGLSCFGGKRNYYALVVHPGAAWLSAIAVGALVAWIVARRPGMERWVRGTAVGGLVAALLVLAFAPAGVRAARHATPDADRDGLMAFLRERHGEGRAIYDCGLTYAVDSIAYIQADVWPRCRSERTACTPDVVPAGGLMGYRKDMLAKRAFGTFVDPADRLVFRSSPEGEYLVYERHDGAGKGREMQADPPRSGGPP